MRSKDCTDDINEISLGVYRNVQGLLSHLHQFCHWYKCYRSHRKKWAPGGSFVFHVGRTKFHEQNIHTIENGKGKKLGHPFHHELFDKYLPECHWTGQHE